MATKAKLSYARISAQKVRLVADQIRGLPVERAINILAVSYTHLTLPTSDLV